MIVLQARLFILLYYRPFTAFARIIDEGSWIFGAAMVLIVSRLSQYAFAQVYRGVGAALPGIFATVIGLAVLFVPACILVVTLIEATGSFSVVLRRDYGPLLTCSLIAWAAAGLPIALIFLTLSAGSSAPVILVSLWCLQIALFAGAMSCAVMALFGTSAGRSVLVVVLGLGILAMSTFLLAVLGPVTSLLGSPFVLYFLYQAFRGELGDIGASFRSRGNFRRQLEAAALNVHDADPHYQLGLIYQQRRQYTQAVEEFKRAIAIDPTEADAHFQLGRIAREQSRLDEAMAYLTATLRLDDKHSFSEIWREIGAVHLQAGRVEEARQYLTKFVGRREYDPEGLYLLGETLLKLSQDTQAAEMFSRAVEAVRMLPPYRRSQMRKWSKLAEAELRKLPK